MSGRFQTVILSNGFIHSFALRREMIDERHKATGKQTKKLPEDRLLAVTTATTTSRGVTMIVLLMLLLLLPSTSSSKLVRLRRSPGNNFGVDRSELLQLNHVPSAGNWSTELRIALILPRDNSRLFSIGKVLPAIELAILDTQVKRLVPGLQWRVLYADSNCSSVKAPLLAFNLQSIDKVWSAVYW
jgi:hypothetical protein